VVAVFLFVLGTGAASATVRAALMAVGLLLAQRIGRPYHGGIILLVSGFLMIAANPLFLVFDPGFQLSFLATLGLIYLSPGIEIGIRRLFRNAVWQKIAVVAGQTLAAQIAVLPWLLFMTGKLAANAFLANLIVLPLIPLVMMTSFLAATSSFLFWPLALPFAWLSYLALAYLLAVASVFSIMPGVISTGSPPLIFVALLYGLIFYVYLSLKYPRRFLLPFHRT
jgi:competence protein ComEC